MTITAKILADSVTSRGERLTTLQLRYPRFIHAEELTHRVLSTGTEIVVPDGFMYDQDLSRNASSSRAIPVERLIQDVVEDTAMPIHWGKNQPGMQAREEHDAPVHFQTCGFGPREGTAQEAWYGARDNAIISAREFAEAGYHKQVVNRLLEPFSHINVVVTATRWTNFFDLRLHPDAQPEILELAKQMQRAMNQSVPHEATIHLPFMTQEDRVGRTLQDQIRISAARCARVSYMTHDGKPTDPEKDIELAATLWESGHFSPFEHQALPTPGVTWANLDGWQSARSLT